MYPIWSSLEDIMGGFCPRPLQEISGKKTHHLSRLSKNFFYPATWQSILSQRSLNPSVNHQAVSIPRRQSSICIRLGPILVRDSHLLEYIQSGSELVARFRYEFPPPGMKFPIGFFGGEIHTGMNFPTPQSESESNLN